MAVKSLYYLRPDVYFEPLFNKWFLWPYLLAPASAAMNVANHQLRAMKSFIANVKLHSQAAQDQSMVGGFFVDCHEDQVDQIKEIIKKTEIEYGDLIEFSEAVKTLDEFLRKEAKGESIEPLYKKVPKILKGYIELVYDLNNNPSIRFIEGLLYQSPLFKKSAQEICLGVLPSEKRPFVLSTPRIPDQNHLHIQIPFDHPFVSALFGMREIPQSLDHLTTLLNGALIEGALDFNDLFTQTPPKPCQTYQGEDIRLRYLGHAGVLIESDKTALMIDPVIPYKNDNSNEKFTFEDLPQQLDYVMVTHTHMDHTCLETLIQLKHKIKTVLVPKNNGGSLADPSIKLMLKSIGFERVMELEDMEKIEYEDGSLTAIPFLGEHADMNIRTKTAWFVDIKGNKIFIAADSSNIDECLYQNIYKTIGNVDVLFIGMEKVGGPLKWLYGYLLTQPITRAMNESRRFNGSDYPSAIQMAKTLQAKQVYVYALGMEPWYRYFMGIAYKEDSPQIIESQKLVNECRASGIISEQLFGKKEIFLSPKQ